MLNLLIGIILILTVRGFDIENKSGPSVNNLLGKVDYLRHIRHITGIQFDNSTQVFICLEFFGTDVKQVNCLEDFLDNCDIWVSPIWQAF